MIEKISSNYYINDINCNNASNISNNSKIKKGLLERSPQTDSLSMSKKAKNSSSFGQRIAITIKQAIIQRRHAKELEQIEQRFLKLRENAPIVQHFFKEVFLRDDITIEETRKMLERYKEIEKIGVTGTKEDYIRAMFEDAKKNYGLAHLPAELKIVDKPIMGNEQILGSTNPLGDITIRATGSPQQLMDTIHHELRHLKQRVYAYMISPEEYVKFSQPTNFEISKEIFEYAMCGEKGITEIPPIYKEFAQNAYKGTVSYHSFSKNETDYFKQWVEDDAYKTGRKITALLHTKAL